MAVTRYEYPGEVYRLSRSDDPGMDKAFIQVDMGSEYETDDRWLSFPILVEEGTLGLRQKVNMVVEVES